MDNLTHTLIGVGMANAGLAKKFGRGTLLTLIMASNLPDLDVPWAYAIGGEAFLSRRMLTHSIFGFPIFAAALAVILRLFYKHFNWKDLWLLILIGTGVHVFFDLVNSYGVVLLYPMSRRRFELAWVFIIDLAIWAILLAPFIVRLFKPAVTSETPWRTSLIVLTTYVLVCGAGRHLSFRHLNTFAQSEPAAQFTYIFPEALGCHRFRGVRRIDSQYHLYLIHAWTGKVEFRGTFETDASDPVVEAIRQTPRARKLEWFFKAPVWRLKRIDGKERAEVFDLRFRSTVLKWQRDPFLFEFAVPATRAAG